MDFSLACQSSPTCGNVLECVQSTDDQQLLQIQSTLCHTRKSNISNPLLSISKNSDDNSNEKGEEEEGPLQAGLALALTHRRDLGHISAVERFWTDADAQKPSQDDLKGAAGGRSELGLVLGIKLRARHRAKHKLYH